MSSLSPISQPPPSPDANTVPPPGTRNLRPPGSSNNTTLIALGVGVGIGGTIVLFAVGIFVLLYRRKKRRRLLTASNLPPPPGPRDDLEYGLPKPDPPPGTALKQNLCQTSCRPPPFASSISTSENPIQQEPRNALGSSKKTFTYEELNLATDGFSDSNLLGQGGFGYVHKGLLSDGKEVAVKCLKIGSGQGEREFQAEVEVISRVNHKHLVSKHIFFMFIPNNTMEFHLHGKGQSTLSWETRMKIAIGAAKGLAYWHEDCHPKIIHRDVKAANILLDNNFEAKLADFGLARFTSETDTHVSTRVMGTFGYLAPEYALTGKLTEKSDIFSFGVVLLELITGRRPIDKGQFFVDDNIVDWARPLMAQALDDGKFESVADERLKKNYMYEEMLRMVACAAVCVRHLARRRPRMSQF